MLSLFSVSLEQYLIFLVAFYGRIRSIIVERDSSGQPRHTDPAAPDEKRSHQKAEENIRLSIYPSNLLSVYPSRLKLLKHQSVTDQSSVRPLFLTSVQGKNLQVLALKHSKKKKSRKGKQRCHKIASKSRGDKYYYYSIVSPYSIVLQ